MNTRAESEAMAGEWSRSGGQDAPAGGGQEGDVMASGEEDIPF